MGRKVASVMLALAIMVSMPLQTIAAETTPVVETVSNDEVATDKVDETVLPDSDMETEENLSSNAIDEENPAQGEPVIESVNNEENINRRNEDSVLSEASPAGESATGKQNLSDGTDIQEESITENQESLLKMSAEKETGGSDAITEESDIVVEDGGELLLGTSSCEDYAFDAADASSKNFKLGDIICFGHRPIYDAPAYVPKDAENALKGKTWGFYQFENHTYQADGSNVFATVPIRWIVLEDEGSDLLVMSEYVFKGIAWKSDTQQDAQSLNWSNSDIREYLTTDNYIKNHFSPEEYTDVLVSRVISPTYNGGTVTTKDKVFIPAPDDVQNYFHNADERKAHYYDWRVPSITTPMSGWGDALAYNREEYTCAYWTRSAKYAKLDMSQPTYVTCDGEVVHGGRVFSTWEIGLRPMMRIKKSSKYYYRAPRNVEIVFESEPVVTEASYQTIPSRIKGDNVSSQTESTIVYNVKRDLSGYRLAGYEEGVHNALEGNFFCATRYSLTAKVLGITPTGIEKKVSVIAVPKKENITVTENEKSNKLQWDATWEYSLQGSQGYEVMRSTEKDGKYKTIWSGKNSSSVANDQAYFKSKNKGYEVGFVYIDTKIDPNRTYWYKVRGLFYSEDSGDSQWVSKMNGQTAPFSDPVVAQRSNNSSGGDEEDEDQVRAFVTRMYRVVLGREPDETGLNYWVNMLKSGDKKGADIAAGFFLSSEIFSRGLSIEEYVELAYLGMMNRPSDAGGKSYWVEAQLSGATCTAIIHGFVGSQEFHNLCAEYCISPGDVPVSEPRDVNLNVTKFVSRLYTQLLGRNFDVDGLNDWISQILANPSKANILHISTHGFLNSMEFLNKNLSDEQFVCVLYRTFLGREADPSGLNYWIDKLATGASRDEVAAGFANSQEFENMMSGVIGGDNSNYDYNSELEEVRNWIRHPTDNNESGISWNGDGKTNDDTVDCNWFSKYKLYKRGLYGNSLKDTYLEHGSVDPTSEDKYISWVQGKGNLGFAQCIVDYLKMRIEENSGEPLYNIYVRDAKETAGMGPHSILIDKAYYDNGVLKLILSDNHAADKIKRDNGADVYNVTDQIPYTENEFITHYSYRHGNPDILRVFGPNKN